MTMPEPVINLRNKLEHLYGDRLRRLVLCGSYAREEHTDDSDIDVAVVLAGPVQPGREIDRMLDAVHAVNLAFDTLVSVYPVSAQDYETVMSPLLLNIRREGVAA